MVINLDAGRNLAITHNYVSPSNLGNLLLFLQEKQEQISGCRDRAESIKPEDLHDSLVRVLQEKEPAVLKEAQAQVGWTCPAWKTEPNNQKNDAPPLDDVKDVPAPAPASSIMSKAAKVSSFSFSFL